MTPTFSEVVFVVLVIGWYLLRIRAPFPPRTDFMERPRSPRNCATADISYRSWYSATHLRGDGNSSFRRVHFPSRPSLAGGFLCDSGFGYVSTNASGARPELVDQS